MSNDIIRLRKVDAACAGRGSFGLGSDSEGEERVNKGARRIGTLGKDPGKHEGDAVASAQRYVPPAARGRLTQGEHACTSFGLACHLPAVRK